MTFQKATVRLGNQYLAATSAIAWRFQSGTRPYTTTFTVTNDIWERALSKNIGVPLTLEIIDAREVVTKVEQVYILHRVQSDSPNRVTFVVADKRWKWSYPLVVRDYNIPRKTGNRTAYDETLPVEKRITVDKYDYLPYSINGVSRWTAQAALQDVLQELEGSAGYRIESFPISESEGGFTLQNVTLRDQGDVALARLLSYIPGCEVYIDAKGQAVVFDASDSAAVDAHFMTLPEKTWNGDAAAMVDRKKIRPSKVVVHYQREVELLLDFGDVYAGTFSDPNKDAPFLENVLPTVDPETLVTRYDPEAGGRVTGLVPPGTWINVKDWLSAMDADRPEGSLPWTFETIKRHWIKGNLEAVLGARGLDLDTEANTTARVQALRTHFRQTFRINRRYMERIRSVRALRVGVLDPITGTRAPASVWSQACIFPSSKGIMARRKDASRAYIARNVDYLYPSSSGTIARIIDSPPGPTKLAIIDEDLGIFRLDWIESPFGTDKSIIPCKVVGSNGQAKVPTRNLQRQNVDPMGAGLQIESGTNGIFLSDTLDLKVLLTIIPAAPNNAMQFHRQTVAASDIRSLFRTEFRIQGGEGPELHVFVPPGEATARFAWADDGPATETVKDLLGLRAEGGLAGTTLPGFVLCNEDRHLEAHAQAVAAEALVAYADNRMGSVVTRVPREGVKLVGNMSGAMVRVGSYPSAKVDAVHEFPGQQPPISRFSMLPESARVILLGVLPFQD